MHVVFKTGFTVYAVVVCKSVLYNVYLWHTCKPCDLVAMYVHTCLLVSSDLSSWILQLYFGGPRLGWSDSVVSIV